MMENGSVGPLEVPTEDTESIHDDSDVQIDIAIDYIDISSEISEFSDIEIPPDTEKKLETLEGNAPDPVIEDHFDESGSTSTISEYVIPDSFCHSENSLSPDIIESLYNDRLFTPGVLSGQRFRRFNVIVQFIGLIIPLLDFTTDYVNAGKLENHC